MPRTGHESRQSVKMNPLTSRFSTTILGSSSPWLLRLELDRAKMIDRKLTMPYVAGRIPESFKTDLFVIWNEDNSEKFIIRCRVLGGGDKDDDGLGTIEEDI
ncbi:hypothetical protein AZE42_10195 [Rhizopogon vesiculosus]|uniref:RNA polymerase Rpb1 domain-containing protein n=1 Tax=Rhizopogon vesiculosus TaxID=180088 RepID=A0A1J8QNY6_9AGAM|nr:hypothetical protein AZE42_10195 [Rhizopogon vesiculosus]